MSVVQRHVTVPFDKRHGISACERMSVLADGVRAELEIGQCAPEEILLQEVTDVRAEPTSAHV